MHFQKEFYFCFSSVFSAIALALQVVTAISTPAPVG